MSSRLSLAVPSLLAMLSDCRYPHVPGIHSQEQVRVQVQ